MSIKVRNIEGLIYSPGCFILGGAAAAPAKVQIQVPTTQVIVARLTLGHNASIEAFVIDITTAPSKGDQLEDRQEYLVWKQGNGLAAAVSDPTVTHGNGTEISERLFLKNTVATPDFIAAINTQLAAGGNGRIVSAGIDLLLCYCETGGVGTTGVRGQFRVREILVNKKSSPNNKVQ